MKEKMNLKRVIPVLAIAIVLAAMVIVMVASQGFGGHYITIGKTTHGTVTADKERAKTKEIVTLTCKPDEGYELKELSVNGSPIEELSFSMPNENVLIEAKFALESDEKGNEGVHAGDTPGAIAYKTVYPNGETYTVSWNLVYGKDGLEATAWVEGAVENGCGVLLNLSKEELAAKTGLKYLPDYTYQIFCEYQKANDVISPKVTVKCADEEGNLKEKDVKGIAAEIKDWEEDGKTVGYQAKMEVPYSLLGYSGKDAAKDSLVFLAGNRAKVLKDTFADFWMEGEEYDAENYLSYPRLVDDNKIEKNKFIDMTEMEMEAYRDIGTVLDGKISKGEYIGTKLEEKSANHRITVQSHLTKGRNVRLVMEIESNTSFEEIVNAYPGVGQYLFAEIGLGNNDGQTCTMIKANVKGEVENAISTVTTSQNGKNSAYKYKAVVEMWIPKASISDNINPNIVRLSRLALFSGNKGAGSKPDNVFLVARWADVNNCNITTSGIKLESEIVPPEAEIKGMDGVLTESEYKGAIIQESSETHRVTVQGYLTDGKHIRLAVKVDANTAPDKLVNDFPGVGKYLFVESAFGNNTGEKDCTFVKANVLGQAAYAAPVAKTTDNGASADYRYSTVIEMWIPQSAITNNTDPDNVAITRLALFSGNTEGNKKPDNLFVIAKWAGINECTLTADGIKFKPQFEVPANEAVGFDGVISNNEYKGAAIEGASDNYKVSVKGYLTEGKNIRLGLEIESKHAPEKVLNNYPGLSQYLFAEFGFGANTGDGDCTLVKANVLGQADQAVSSVKTTDNGASAEYRYKTVIEMWIPQSSITKNNTPDEVPMTRMGLFHVLDKEDPTTNWLVAKWAGINECTLTADGIQLKAQEQPGTGDNTEDKPQEEPQMQVPASEADGFDGVISEGEYQGEIFESTTDNYHTTIQGHLTDEKNVRLVLKVQSKVAPETVVNKFGEALSQPFFVEFGFGENTGNGDCTLVKANILGKAENAAAIAKTTDKGANTEYRYETVVEVWVPKASVTNNTNEDEVRISRLALFHDTKAKPDAGIDFVVAKWAGINDCTVTASGIELDSTIKVPANEATGFDGVISANEYKGAKIESSSANYKASVQGYLTEGKNIRLAMEILTKTAPDAVVNNYEGLSKHLFAELAFGENDGQVASAFLKANVLGKAEGMATVVKTTSNAVNTEYPYKTVIEMWIPKEAIHNNTNEDNVQITRMALFHETDPIDAGINWMVAKWAGINNCSITSYGILDSERQGMDGVASTNEYKGVALEGNASNFKATVKGFLTGQKNARLLIQIDSKFNPEESRNDFPGVGSHLFAEIGFGENTGNGDCTLVKANVLGEAENAEAVAKTVDNGESAEYRYTTTIEMLVPSSSFTNNLIPEEVRICRLAIFNENAGTFMVANWTGTSLNPCHITADGIKNGLAIPEAEKTGFDGVIAQNEYKGILLDSTKGASASIDYKMTVQGYVNDAQNLRLGVTVFSNVDPKAVVNPAEKFSEYLYAEFCFGDNDGNTANIFADFRGKAQNAVTVIKTEELGAGAEYAYKTVMEMWIPKDKVTNNPTPNKVQFTRAALFHQNHANPENVNETWLVLRSAWNGGGMNNCYVTTEGIVESHLLAGMDGTISENEYAGTIIDGSHTNQSNYKVTMQGYLQGTVKNQHSIRLAVKIDAKTAPEENVNPFTLFSEKLYVDFAFGDVTGAEERTSVYADVLGKASNAVTVVKTTDNGEGAGYRYTTVIEMWIPQEGISVESHDDLVWVPRFGVYHQNILNDTETWVVAKWASLHYWLRVTGSGLVE